MTIYEGRNTIDIGNKFVINLNLISTYMYKIGYQIEEGKFKNLKIKL